MGNAHQVVIDHIGQEVGGQAVGLHQDLHIHAVPGNFHRTTQQVRHHADTLTGHLHAHHVRLAGGDALLCFLCRQMHAVPVIARGFLACLLLGTHLIETFSGAEAGEGMTFGNQLIRILLVDVAPLALPIRTVRPAHIRPLVPFDTQPAQGIEYLLLGLARRAQLVGIFDTQDELAAVLASKAQVEQGNVGSANMRIAGGRWRDTGTDGGHGDSRNRLPKQE